MSNAARHILGVVAGLLLTPIIALGLMYGSGQVVHGFQIFSTPWVGAGVLAACAVALGFLAGSRLSPVASLMAGLVYTAMGTVLMIVELYPSWLADLLPMPLRMGFNVLGPTGALFIAGILLLTASAFPSRWRAARPAPSAPSYDPPQQQQQYPPAFDPFQPAPFQPAGPGGDDQTRPMPR
ncbi:hypothetical protein AB0G06_32765 [Nonomuraea dietziae]|uniref:hypothetical protein n=1 Tax=Nonomuraea dietziae TaxID=65515 RepID=UPI0033D07E1C